MHDPDYNGVVYPACTGRICDGAQEELKCTHVNDRDLGGHCDGGLIAFAKKSEKKENPTTKSDQSRLNV